jgi:hypothetical protein
VDQVTEAFPAAVLGSHLWASLAAELEPYGLVASLQLKLMLHRAALRPRLLRRHHLKQTLRAIERHPRRWPAWVMRSQRLQLQQPRLCSWLQPFLDWPAAFCPLPMAMYEQHCLQQELEMLRRQAECFPVKLPPLGEH